MKFSVIIPVFNEERTVNRLINKVKKVKYPGTREIVVVNDGSTDNTLKILNGQKGITLINNPKNKGKGYSLRVALKKAKGEIIIIQDADLEYNPQEHLKLISKLKENHLVVVYGSRFLEKNHHPRYTLFYFGNIFLSLVTKVLYQKKVTDMETCYKAFKKSALKNIKLSEDRFGFEPEITCKFIKKGYEIAEVPISYKSRSYKEGKKIGVADGLRALYILLKYRITN